MIAQRAGRRRPGVAVAAVVLALAAFAGVAAAQGHVRARPLRLGSGADWIGAGIAYGPHRDGQRPGGPTPSRAEIREDLHLLARHWRLLRLYGSAELADTVLAVIRDDHLDLNLLLGVWIAPEEKRDATGHVTETLPAAIESNRREIEAGVRLANDYPRQVRALVVGNETQVYWSATRVPEERLIDAIREVRRRTHVPVTTGDDFAYWESPASRTLAGEVDFVMVHLHPLWNGSPLDSALAWVGRHHAATRALHRDRAVVIGETGWATRRNGEGDQGKLMRGAIGEPEQARFVRELDDWVMRTRVPTVLFEAFDENWKGGPDPADVEKHWGVYHADRTPKLAMQGAR